MYLMRSRNDFDRSSNNYTLIMTMFTIMLSLVNGYEWRCVIMYSHELTGNVYIFVYHCVIVCCFRPLFWFMQVVDIFHIFGVYLVFVGDIV